MFLTMWMSCRERCGKWRRQLRSPDASHPTPGSSNCRSHWNTTGRPVSYSRARGGGWGKPRRGHLQSAVPSRQLVWPWPGFHRWLCVSTLTFRVLTAGIDTQQCGIEPLLDTTIPSPHHLPPWCSLALLWHSSLSFVLILATYQKIMCSKDHLRPFSTSVWRAVDVLFCWTVVTKLWRPEENLAPENRESWMKNKSFFQWITLDFNSQIYT